MSKNVYKSNWVVVSDDEKCVIDSNQRVAQRIEELKELDRARTNAENVSEEGEGDGFVSGLGGEAIDAVLTDETESGNVIKAEKEQGPDLEEIQAQAQAILEDARTQADQLKAQAQAEIDASRRQEMEKANKLGYEEGYHRGHAEADQLKQALEEEKNRLEQSYAQRMEELEPQFIDTITAIYNHIFAVELSDNRDILVHLIDTTLHRIESSRTYIVHVSAEDYPHVNMQKQALVEEAINGKGIIDIVEDIALNKGDCMIETDGGIFDCGIGTQLEELTKKLRVLSFDGSNN